jgi:hypothetical protein
MEAARMDIESLTDLLLPSVFVLPSNLRVTLMAEFMATRKRKRQYEFDAHYYKRCHRLIGDQIKRLGVIEQVCKGMEWWVINNNGEVWNKCAEWWHVHQNNGCSCMIRALHTACCDLALMAHSDFERYVACDGCVICGAEVHDTVCDGCLPKYNDAGLTDADECQICGWAELHINPLVYAKKLYMLNRYVENKQIELQETKETHDIQELGGRALYIFVATQRQIYILQHALDVVHCIDELQIDDDWPHHGDAEIGTCSLPTEAKDIKLFVLALDLI